MLRGLSFLYNILSTKLFPYLYEIAQPFPRWYHNPSCFKPSWCRIKLFHLPFTISELNKLDPDIRNNDSFLYFAIIFELL